MSVPFSNTKLRVPAGFRSLMWVVTKEVLRFPVHDIVAFCADFLDKLLQLRAETGHDPVVEGAHAEDRFYYRCGFDALMQQPVKTVEAEPTAQPEEEDNTDSDPLFPPLLTSEEEEEEEEEESTTGPSSSDAAEPSAPAGQNDLDIDLSDPELDKAAVKIQAQFRGHIARRKK